MTDIEIMKDATGETMMVQAQAVSDEGTDFIDAWMPKRDPAAIFVVDSGRVILSEEDLPTFVEECKTRGLQVAEA